MNNILKVFKYIAFLNIPFILVGFYFAYKPLVQLAEPEELIEGASIALILLGFGLTFTSLRDVKKIDKMGRFIIERPKIFKWFIAITMSMGIISLFVGLAVMFVWEERLNLGIGITSFGLGYLALIKSIIDQAKDLTDHY
ncbi:MAG: hypothetical protein NXI20_08795 [bacterium]|nr:hypothetical protein [bacterium]